MNLWKGRQTIMKQYVSSISANKYMEGTLSVHTAYSRGTVLATSLVPLGSQGSKSGGSEVPGTTEISVGQLIDPLAGPVGTPPPHCYSLYNVKPGIKNTSFHQQHICRDSL